MAGHSKWANTKHRKERQDKKRAKEFAKHIRAIEVAAKQAGTSDPSMDAALNLVVTKAKQASVPKDTIDRACKRGAGELGEASDYTEAQYEGYAPGGVAILVDCLTDNRNRTAADVRNAFTKSGGTMADAGSVAYLFGRKGQVVVVADSEDDVMLAGLEAGLTDVDDAGEGTFVAWCEATDVLGLVTAFEEAGLEVKDSGSTMVADMDVPVADMSDLKKILRIIDQLEDCDDVQDVYSNFDAPQEMIEEAMADA